MVRGPYRSCAAHAKEGKKAGTFSPVFLVPNPASAVAVGSARTTGFLNAANDDAYTPLLFLAVSLSPSVSPLVSFLLFFIIASRQYSGVPKGWASLLPLAASIPRRSPLFRPRCQNPAKLDPSLTSTQKPLTQRYRLLEPCRHFPPIFLSLFCCAPRSPLVRNIDTFRVQIRTGCSNEVQSPAASQFTTTSGAVRRGSRTGRED